MKWEEKARLLSVGEKDGGTKHIELELYARIPGFLISIQGERFLRPIDFEYLSNELPSD
ncbi:hypothetical protein SLEP1_g32600 [Rubroshorea leprosula]|uniref:Uncharacterized protein n=1 Tax=Rubroshorea leprosula TaxID=152421 RepID=A0AAV5KDV9_9ROSI|nr:hypothetical protein SLEP1_g32600 [Rubroshorea leprosula]